MSKPFRVTIEQELNSGCVRRRDDQPGMMLLIQPPYYFGVIIARKIGPFLMSQAVNDARVAWMCLRQLILLTTQVGDFDFRPLTPEVDTTGIFDTFCNVSATYAGCVF